MSVYRPVHASAVELEWVVFVTVCHEATTSKVASSLHSDSNVVKPLQHGTVSPVVVGISALCFPLFLSYLLLCIR